MARRWRKRRFTKRKFRRRYTRRKSTNFKSRRGRRSRNLSRRRFLRKKDLSMPAAKRNIILRYASGNDIPALVGPGGSAYGQINIAVNDLNWFVRQQNGVVAPNPTPIPMKEEWGSWYNRWRVNLVKFNVSIQNPGLGSGYVAISYDPVFTVPTNITAPWADVMRIMKSNTGWTWKMIGPAYSPNSHVHLKLAVTPGRMQGNMSEYRADLGFTGGSDSGATPYAVSPTKILNVAIMFLSNDGSNFAGNYSLTVSVTADIFATWRNRQQESN